MLATNGTAPSLRTGPKVEEIEPAKRRGAHMAFEHFGVALCQRIDSRRAFCARCAQALAERFAMYIVAAARNAAENTHDRCRQGVGNDVGPNREARRFPKELALRGRVAGPVAVR